MINKRAAKVLDRFRVTSGKGFRLKDFGTDDTAGIDLEKDHAAALLKQGVERLAELQDMLYAQDRWSVLCIFQAMDAAGKDGAIKHVFSGVNPRAARCIPSRRRPRPSSTTTSCGGIRPRCPSAGASASTTGPGTRKCSRCACIRNSSRARSCRRAWWARMCSTSGSRISRPMNATSRGRARWC